MVLVIIILSKMQKPWFFIGLILLLWALSNCSGQRATTGHNSMNAIDWPGVYRGTIPCADCEGIVTTLTLMKDLTFTRTVTYAGKDDRPRYDKGTLRWNSGGSVLILNSQDGSVQSYQVGENVLFHLDQEGKRITGDLADRYILHKNKTDRRLEGKKWILTELMGQKIEAGQTNRQAFLLFNPEKATFTGNGSCNNLFGTYELKEGDRIAFGEAAGTLMACPDMELEDRFFEVLKTADNYSISDSTLSLNKARMAPLARFTLEHP